MDHQDIIDMIGRGEIEAAEAAIATRTRQNGISGHDRGTIDAALAAARAAPVEEPQATPKSPRPAHADDGKVKCPACGRLNQVPEGAEGFTCSNCGADLVINPDNE